MKIKGAFPVRWQAQNGQPGTGVTVDRMNSFTKYAASTSGTTHPADSSSDWKLTVPTVADGSYLWTWVHVAYSDGSHTDAYSVSRMGIDGRGIQSSVVTYSQQASPVDPATITNWGAFPSSLTDGYWLYTKTHVVYSDGATTDSYSVSQIGVGAYYAGCQEYWATSNSDTTPPSGYPNTKSFVDGVATYANGETCSVSDPWSTDRPTADNSTPYIWNFEISYDSRGNKYVTRPICIGNFSKGIASIVEAYAISAYGAPNSVQQNYPTDIASNDWQDESHAVAPTNAKRYQWNRTTVNYNNGSPDVFYHVSAVKGADGIGATYLDLDNENDSMLYDGKGNLVSGNAVSNIRLYSNGQMVQNPPTFSIQEKSASVTASISGSVLTVTGITSDSGYVIVQCTYNNEPYTTRMTIKRLVGVDKYDIVLSQNAITYNETDETPNSVDITVKLYRTTIDGTRALSLPPSGYYLCAAYGDAISAYTKKNNANTITVSVYPSATVADYVRILLCKVGARDAIDNDNVLDVECVPINRVENGGPGEGAVVVDLDNENDSMLYDGAGNLVSGNVVSNAKLLVGADDETQSTSWALGSYSGMASTQVSISGNTVTVTGMSANASSGYVDVVGTYGGHQYTKRLTLKKLRGVDKFELVCNPSALTYNSNAGTGAQQEVNIKVFRTAQNGERTLVQSLSTYGLKLRYYWVTNGTDAGPTQITDGTAAGYYNSGVTKTVYASMYTAYRYELLNSGNLVLDSETVPIGHVSNGTGTKGADAKSVYKNSFSKPSTPTGATPSGWSNDVPAQTEMTVQAQGDWYLTDDGYMTAPLIALNQSTVETFSFVTTEANQKVYIRLKCSTSAYDKVYIGNVDTVTPSASGHYMREVHGSSQDTGDIEVTVANAGAHFICVAYVRGNSGLSGYVKFVCGNMFLWKSDATTFNTDGTVSVWGTPYKVSGKDSAFTTQTKTNQLLQTNFIASRMDKWVEKNGATTGGVDGRNGYHGTPNISTDYKELLRQVMCDPNGEKRLLANTWYTLSFWAKAAPYVQVDKNETSENYGFATQICYFEAGVQNTVMVNGYCSSAARSAGKSLRVYVYNEDWSWQTSVAITATGSTTQSMTFTVPSSGKYYISAYVYLEPNGKNSAVSGQTATVNWYRINRGMRMITYLWPSGISGSETQDEYTCIDVGAGRIMDGVLMANSSPTDNRATWQLTEEWTKHTLTFKTRNTIPAREQSFLVRMAQSSNDVYICMPKIEQGTVATDYCTNDSDIADIAADTSGYPRECGIYNDEQEYSWNEHFRDFIDYEFDGTWYRYGVKRKGMIIPAGTPPTLVGGDDNWEVANRIQTLITDTIFGSNANIGGFMATASRMLSQNQSLFLDGVNGLIRLMHSDGYRWEVKQNGIQMLGVENGMRIELDPCTKEFRIYDESGHCVTSMSGLSVSSLSSIFNGSTGSVTFNVDKSGGKTVSGGSGDGDTKEVGHFTTTGTTRLTLKGGISVSTSCNIGDPYYQGPKSTASVSIQIKSYTDSSKSTLLRTINVCSAGCSANGSDSESFYNVGLDFEMLEGYHVILVTYTVVTFTSGNQTGSASASWNLTSGVIVNEIYLSNLFANGVSYGSSLHNFFVALNLNNKMMVKAITTNSNSKKNGFELSETGLSVLHGDKAIRPVVTLGLGRVICSSSPSFQSSKNCVRDGGNLSVSRIGTGIFRITFPSDWQDIIANTNSLYVNLIGYKNNQYFSGQLTNVAIVNALTTGYFDFAVGTNTAADYGYYVDFEVKYMLP